MINRTKKVKLHGKYRALQRGWPSGKYVPRLNVNGVWLERAGFKVGDAAEITVTDRMLIIKNTTVHGDH